MDKIQILEGEFDQHEEAIKIFQSMGMEVLPPIDNLYREPGKLELLKERDPEFIYIRTTGLVDGGRLEGRKRLIETFHELKWKPDNVVFFDDESVFAFHATAKALSKYGTRFWFLPFSFEKELRPINWLE